jgi:hypothetical protein
MDLTVPYTFYPLALPHWIAWTLFALAMLCGGAGLLGTMGFLAATILASMVITFFVPDQ